MARMRVEGFSLNLGEQKTLRQIIFFLLVGGSSSLLELVVFWLLDSFSFLGMALSNVIAVIIATVYNFSLNGTVTFKGSSNVLRSAVLYLLLFAFNTFFSTAVISYFVSMGAPSVLMKIITMGCIATWNFVLYKKVVFK